MIHKLYVYSRIMCIEYSYIVDVWYDCSVYLWYSSYVFLTNFSYGFKHCSNVLVLTIFVAAWDFFQVIGL